MWVGPHTHSLTQKGIQTNHVNKIDIATEGIFKTQFYDQVSTKEFSSLVFPPKYSLPFHPPRDGEGAYTGEEDNEDEDKEDEDEDEEKTEEEIEEDIEKEVEQKLKKRILKCREVIAKKDRSV